MNRRPEIDPPTVEGVPAGGVAEAAVLGQFLRSSDDVNPLGLSALRCVIAPNASLEDLMDDANCLFSAGIDAVEAVSESIGTDNVPPEVAQAWWSMLYTLRMARQVFRHAHEKAHEVERLAKGGAA
jgi:hypothetical protein